MRGSWGGGGMSEFDITFELFTLLLGLTMAEVLAEGETRIVVAGTEAAQS